MILFLVASLLEQASFVWVELTLAAFAALAYFFLSGREPQRRQKPCVKPQPQPVPVVKPATAAISSPSKAISSKSVAHAYSYDARTLHAMMDNAQIPVNMQLATTVLESDAAQTDSTLVEKLFTKVAAEDVAFLRGLHEKATASTSPSLVRSGISSVSTTASTSFPQADEITALKDFVSDNAPCLKPLSAKEVAMRANDIRSSGKKGDLRGAVKVFQRLGSQGQNPVLVNSMLEACLDNKEMTMANECFDQARTLGVADCIVYNTMIKHYLGQGQDTAAKKLLTELSDKGMTAMRSTFHGLLNATVNANDLKGSWKLVREMQASGIDPNAVTCSMLMKGSLNSLADLSRVLALIESMDSAMDERLFMSVAEACIRTGRLDLLTKQFEKFLKQNPGVHLSPPTFGTMIRAYGHARDTKLVWGVWEKMLVHCGCPTSVTLGCMVEALVANGRALDAWQLTQKLWADEKTRPIVNTVIYSTILKGFAHNKETDKVMALYEEMRAHKIQPNTITYNTILNSFAQGGAMNRVPALLEDMKACFPPVEPDIVTYSTIVKGFCNSSSLDRALDVLKDMKARGKYSPDEVLYNSLLSGCAKEHRPDEALMLLNDMKKTGVAPSNYTLSILVKLMGRCRRLNQAFIMVEDISKEYNLKINVQVYTSLVQGCFNAGQAGKGIALLDKIIKEGLQPDAMTYTVLVRGCLQAGLVDKAVEFARMAHGLGAGLPSQGSIPPGLAAGCVEEVLAALPGGLESEAAKTLQHELGEFQPAQSGGKGDNSRYVARKGGGKGAVDSQQAATCSKIVH